MPIPSKGSSRRLALSAPIIAVAAVCPALLADSGWSSDAALAASGGEPARSAPARTRGPGIWVIGDSLSVGTQPHLRRALPRWRVSVNARVGRSLAEGMRIFRSRRVLPRVVVLALFTNDDPRSTARLRNALEESAWRQRRGCVTWATIARPAVDGVSYVAANRLMNAAAKRHRHRLLAIPWAERYARHRRWRAPDRVHATTAGLRARAGMLADATRRCAPPGTRVSEARS